MRLWRSWTAVVCLGAAVWSPVAGAQLAVLNGAASSAPDSLSEALVIQLADSELLVSAHVLSKGDDADDVARNMLGAGAARIVIWTVRVAEGMHELRCVFRHASSVESTTTRLRGAWGPALERTIALKVRELLDELSRDPIPARAPPASGSDPAQAAEAPPTPQARAVLARAPSHPPATATSPLVAVGVGGMTASGNAGGQAALGVGAGGAMTVGAGRAELWLRAHWVANPLTAGAPTGRVTTREWIPELSVHGLRRLDPSWLGGYLSLALRIVHAQGVSAAGEHGEQTRTVPSLGAGAEARLRLVSALWARCALGAELALKAQRFAVDGQTLLELGTFRGRAELSLVFSP
jgi:hypothetical protein